MTMKEFIHLSVVPAEATWVFPEHEEPASQEGWYWKHRAVAVYHGPFESEQLAREAVENVQHPCPCGSGMESSWNNDARGIPLCRTCHKCHDSKMAKYRPEVLTNPGYYADEPIDAED